MESNQGTYDVMERRNMLARQRRANLTISHGALDVLHVLHYSLYFPFFNLYFPISDFSYFRFHICD